MSGNDTTEKIIISNTKVEEEVINDGKHIYQSTTADFNIKELTFSGNKDAENIVEEASTSAVKATESSSADKQVEESIDKASTSALKATETNFINNQGKEIIHEAPEHSMPLDVDTEPIVGINVPEETVNDVSEDIDQSVSSDSSLQTESDIVEWNCGIRERCRAYLLLCILIIAVIVAVVSILHYTFKAF
ncbi:uncharacterized protein LOC143452316 isoform X2 [Clavelina lepadiformis]|uniref:uncharacterized protein LOC143452316 isoform X2 n=1 Tax=Clavelina lepadiformis TaxID=159417 RepID=UPI004042F193